MHFLNWSNPLFRFDGRKIQFKGKKIQPKLFKINNMSDNMQVLPLFKSKKKLFWSITSIVLSHCLVLSIIVPVNYLTEANYVPCLWFCSISNRFFPDYIWVTICGARLTLYTFFAKCSEDPSLCSFYPEMAGTTFLRKETDSITVCSTDYNEGTARFPFPSTQLTFFYVCKLRFFFQRC